MVPSKNSNLPNVGDASQAVSSWSTDMNTKLTRPLRVVAVSGALQSPSKSASLAQYLIADQVLCQPKLVDLGAASTAANGVSLAHSGDGCRRAGAGRGRGGRCSGGRHPSFPWLVHWAVQTLLRPHRTRHPDRQARVTSRYWRQSTPRVGDRPSDATTVQFFPGTYFAIRCLCHRQGLRGARPERPSIDRAGQADGSTGFALA